MNSTDSLFSTTRDTIGLIEIRRLDLQEDLELIHDWVSRDYAVYWRMQNMSLSQVEAVYREKLDRKNYHAFIGVLESSREAVFLFEVYNPIDDELGDFYNPSETDRGFHLIVAPNKPLIKDFSWHVLMTVLAFIFSDPRTQRIVGEPDIANKKIITLLLQCGYSLGPVIYLRNKTARFVYISREKFNAVNAQGIRPVVEYSLHPVKLSYHQLVGKARRKVLRAVTRVQTAIR
jgi:RimJ/RimL family protein N-acetyltransferase